MEVLVKIDWNVLNTYIADGKIIVNKHPEYDLWILNYSKDTQFEGSWDIYTLSCRGIVVDSEGNIIARSMKKFFNYEEVINKIDINRPFEAYEKMDGSLIEIFYYNDERTWIVASRGSFTSEHALLATKIFNERIDSNLLSNAHTYIFELIAPFNKIVVDYGNVVDLVLLAVIQTDNGVELLYDEMVGEYSNHLNIVERYFKYGNDIKITDLKSYEEDNREGFVIRFEDGERIKVKFDTYVYLHRIVTNISNKSVWEHLMMGKPFDEILKRVPDELFDWLKKTKSDLERQFRDFEHEILKEFYQIYFKEGIVDRKTFALRVAELKNRGFLFGLYNGRDYSEAIWRKIKPKFSKPFRNGCEDN